MLDPIDLAAMKTVSASERRSAPKGGTDIADLRRILLTFLELKVEDGAVAAHLRRTNASDRTLDFWREVVRAPIDAEADDSDGDETE